MSSSRCRFVRRCRAGTARPHSQPLSQPGRGAISSRPGAPHGDSRRERIDDKQAFQILARLQILRQQLGAAAKLGGGDDERIPPVEAIASLNMPGLLDRGRVEDTGTPGEESAHFGLGLVRREGGSQLLRDYRIILVQYLGAEPAAAVTPELFQPLASPLMFGRVALRVAGVDQQIGVNEVPRGHRAFPAWVT